MAAPLRIGLIGNGWIARDHVSVLGKLGDGVVAACDIDLERAAKVAPADARIYGAWEARILVEAEGAT